MCQDTELVITKLGRFDEATFAEAKEKSHSDTQLKKLIKETSLRLEKFPRKNRHSQQWYEKYFQKF